LHCVCGPRSPPCDALLCLAATAEDSHEYKMRYLDERLLVPGATGRAAAVNMSFHKTHTGNGVTTGKSNTLGWLSAELGIKFSIIAWSRMQCQQQTISGASRRQRAAEVGYSRRTKATSRMTTTNTAKSLRTNARLPVTEA